MNRRRDRRIGPHEAQFPPQRVFQVRIPASLSDADAPAIHRNRACDDKVNSRHLLRTDRAPELEGASYRGNRWNLRSKLIGVELDKAAFLPEPGDSHTHALAVPQGQLAHRALGRIRIGFYRSCRRPFRLLSEKPRCLLCAHEIRYAAAGSGKQRIRRLADSPLQLAPHLLSPGLLVHHPARDSYRSSGSSTATLVARAAFCARGIRTCQGGRCSSSRAGGRVQQWVTTKRGKG